ncbi:MAG: hypothetical protein NTZ10_06010 [Candidatus Saganbacteria bacterium]|nr:hypothetical protein [Candidatus Saganbacteria bacterium]
MPIIDDKQYNSFLDIPEFPRLRTLLNDAVTSGNVRAIRSAAEDFKKHPDWWRGFCERSDIDDRAFDIITKAALGITSANATENKNILLYTINQHMKEILGSTQYEYKIVYGAVRLEIEGNEETKLEKNIPYLSKIDDLIEKRKFEEAYSSMKELLCLKTAGGMPLTEIIDNRPNNKVKPGMCEPWFTSSIYRKMAKACVFMGIHTKEQKYFDEAVNYLKKSELVTLEYYGANFKTDGQVDATLIYGLKLRLLSDEDETRRKALSEITGKIPIADLFLYIESEIMDAGMKKIEAASADINKLPPVKIVDSLNTLNGFLTAKVKTTEIVGFFDGASKKNPWLRTNLYRAIGHLLISLSTTKDTLTTDDRKKLATIFNISLTNEAGKFTLEEKKLLIDTAVNKYLDPALAHAVNYYKPDRNDRKDISDVIKTLETNKDTAALNDVAGLYVVIQTELAFASNALGSIYDKAAKTESDAKTAADYRKKADGYFKVVADARGPALEIAGKCKTPDINNMTARFKVVCGEASLIVAYNKLDADTRDANAELIKCLKEWEAMQAKTGEPSKEKADAPVSVELKILMTSAFRATLFKVQLSLMGLSLNHEMNKENKLGSIEKELSELSLLENELAKLPDLLNERDLKMLGLLKIEGLFQKYFVLKSLGNTYTDKTGKRGSVLASELFAMLGPAIQRFLVVDPKAEKKENAELEALNKKLTDDDSDIYADAALYLVTFKLLEAGSDIEKLKHARALIEKVLESEIYKSGIKGEYFKLSADLLALEVSSSLRQAYKTSGNADGVSAQTSAQTAKMKQYLSSLTGIEAGKIVFNFNKLTKADLALITAAIGKVKHKDLRAKALLILAETILSNIDDTFEDALESINNVFNLAQTARGYLKDSYYNKSASLLMVEASLRQWYLLRNKNKDTGEVETQLQEAISKIIPEWTFGTEKAAYEQTLITNAIEDVDSSLAVKAAVIIARVRLAQAIDTYEEKVDSPISFDHVIDIAKAVAGITKTKDSERDIMTAKVLQAEALLAKYYRAKDLTEEVELPKEISDIPNSFGIDTNNIDTSKAMLIKNNSFNRDLILRALLVAYDVKASQAIDKRDITALLNIKGSLEALLKEPYFSGILSKGYYKLQLQLKIAECAYIAALTALGTNDPALRTKGAGLAIEAAGLAKIALIGDGTPSIGNIRTVFESHSNVGLGPISARLILLMAENDIYSANSKDNRNEKLTIARTAKSLLDIIYDPNKLGLLKGRSLFEARLCQAEILLLLSSDQNISEEKKLGLKIGAFKDCFLIFKYCKSEEIKSRAKTRMRECLRDGGSNEIRAINDIYKELLNKYGQKE